MNKILSIVIATRNREFYCIEAIKNILGYKEMDFELVIHDNSDSKTISNFVSQLNDTRLIYKYVQGRINSAINMDCALSMATGEYVTMIGDDDTILPTIFSVVNWAKKNDYQCVSPTHQVKYSWPNEITGDMGKATWSIPANKHWSLNGENQLIRLLKNGIINYNSFMLPKVYHGIVKRDILIEIKDKVGHFIGGLSPDIYLAVACSILCKKYIVIDYPITIAGACPSSSTAESSKGGHRGNLSDAPHLYKRENYVWDLRIPKIYSVETIWGESALKAITELNRNDLMLYFRQGCFLAGLIGNNISLISLIMDKLKSMRFLNNYYITYVDFLLFLIKKAVIRLYRAIFKQKTYIVSNVKDISEVVERYKQYYKLISVE